MKEQKQEQEINSLSAIWIYDNFGDGILSCSKCKSPIRKSRTGEYICPSCKKKIRIF